MLTHPLSARARSSLRSKRDVETLQWCEISTADRCHPRIGGQYRLVLALCYRQIRYSRVTAFRINVVITLQASLVNIE